MQIGSQKEFKRKEKSKQMKKKIMLLISVKIVLLLEKLLPLLYQDLHVRYQLF